MNLQELIHLLKTSQDVKQIDDRKEEIADLIPKVRIMFGYDQENSAHQYDLWMHRNDYEKKSEQLNQGQCDFQAE